MQLSKRQTENKGLFDTEVANPNIWREEGMGCVTKERTWNVALLCWTCVHLRILLFHIIGSCVLRFDHLRILNKDNRERNQRLTERQFSVNCVAVLTLWTFHSFRSIFSMVGSFYNTGFSFIFFYIPKKPNTYKQNCTDIQTMTPSHLPRPACSQTCTPIPSAWIIVCNLVLNCTDEFFSVTHAISIIHH